MYDVLVCAQLEQELFESTGETFNQTKPVEAEVLSYEENPYYHDCVEQYKEEYDIVIDKTDPSTDLCRSLLK
jgi:hypothetical protein